MWAKTNGAYHFFLPSFSMCIERDIDIFCMLAIAASILFCAAGARHYHGPGSLHVGTNEALVLHDALLQDMHIVCDHCARLELVNCTFLATHNTSAPLVAVTAAPQTVIVIRNNTVDCTACGGGGSVRGCCLDYAMRFDLAAHEATIDLSGNKLLFSKATTVH
jgi:hypothetical protein